MRRCVAAIVLGLALLAASPAAAVLPDEMLGDPALEARARALSKIIRCLVCQNQSIDDSGADLARDLRILVRQRLTAGDSDGQVLDYLVKRYGDFVLLKPRVRGATYVLWFGPLALFLMGTLGVALFLRKRRRAIAGGDAVAAPLSADEERRLARLLDDGDM